MEPAEDAVTDRASYDRRFYRNTQTEVRLGDRVRIRRRFRKFIGGTFCYVPGDSPPDPRMRSHWVIKTDEGTLLSNGHLSAPVLPTGPYRSRFAEINKRIIFLRRRETSDPDPERLLTPLPHSLMFYHGTDTEILVGDRIRFRSIFRGWRILEGTITHIPGIASADPDLCEGEWAYATDDGWAFSGGYYPGRVVKGFTFLHRGTNPFARSVASEGGMNL